MFGENISTNDLNDIIIVTGASGYIASHLIPELLKQGYTVRVMLRNPQGIEIHDWAAKVQVIGDNSEIYRSVSSFFDGVVEITHGHGSSSRKYLQANFEDLLRARFPVQVSAGECYM